MTGLANILINGIISVAGNQIIIALFLTMICCIVLGMGVPTTANYCIMAATCAPILVRMGVSAIAAFVVPYAFALNPVMLFIGVEGPLQVIEIVLTSLIGIFGVSAALEGYVMCRMNPIQRILSAAVTGA